ISDRTDEFMAGDHWHGHGLLSPLVPVVDVYIGAADRGFPDLDQHVVGTDLGNRHFLHPDPRLDFRLHQRAHHVGHHTTPGSRPTATKASTVRSTSAAEWAADICVRMRACPFGTTGKEKPIT